MIKNLLVLGALCLLATACWSHPNVYVWGKSPLNPPLNAPTVSSNVDVRMFLLSSDEGANEIDKIKDVWMTDDAYAAPPCLDKTLVAQPKPIVIVPNNQVAATAADMVLVKDFKGRDGTGCGFTKAVKFLLVVADFQGKESKTQNDAWKLLVPVGQLNAKMIQATEFQLSLVPRLDQRGRQ